MVSSAPRRMMSLVFAAALGITSADLVSLGSLGSGTALAERRGRIQLSVSRQPDSLEIVLKGVGEQPLLQQRLNGDAWEGRLRTNGRPGLKAGAQTIRLPELGIASVSLSGGGDSYRLAVTPASGQSMQDPVVSADGENLILTFSGLKSPQQQSGRLDLTTPGRVPQSRYAPPLRSRAVAPPLGDMAVGTMVLQNRSFVNVSGPPVTLTLNRASARDALLAMARLGGYGFIYLDDSEQAPSATDAGGTNSVERTVTMSFVKESYARALNSLLLASGLQGKLDGRMLLVGASVSGKTFGPQVSKVYRLNQASAGSAADYLASLGAKISKINTTSITSGSPASAGTAQVSTQTSQTTSTLTSVETYGSAVGPLKGLTGTTDSRLQTITLVGDSQLVAVAEGYLKQIDLRQRQIASSVMFLDINLDNDRDIANSFAFRTGNMFIVNDEGRLLANFGKYKPPSGAAGGLPGRYDGSIGSPVPGVADLSGTNDVFFDQPTSAYGLPGSKTELYGRPTNLSVARPDLGTFDNPYQPGVSEISENGSVEFTAPTKFQYPPDQFFDFLRAQIVSSSTKILASPTLIVQEGGEKMTGSDAEKISQDGKVGRELSNEAFVRVGSNFVTSYKVKQNENGNTFCEPVLSNAGLTFGARVEKIDDNGFITFALSPEISAPVGTQNAGTCGNIVTLNDRALDTGKIRVRDGQTLILTGVISDTDIETVTKWPILGDIPLIGQFFRNTSGKRSKSELVILVTPRIIDDERGGTYGYGYKPSFPASRQLMSGS